VVNVPFLSSLKRTLSIGGLFWPSSLRVPPTQESLAGSKPPRCENYFLRCLAMTHTELRQKDKVVCPTMGHGFGPGSTMDLVERW
jgi:hypothetical protein